MPRSDQATIGRRGFRSKLGQSHRNSGTTLFDTLFNWNGHFRANGVDQASEESLRQRDRDGSVLKELPPVWGGLTAEGVTPAVTQPMTEHLPNGPFMVDDPHRFNVLLSAVTDDLWHRFYQNQRQSDQGKNDMCVAWADSGAMPMGIWDGSRMAMWNVATKYTLADNFFMGAFGGSFLNHMWLACACAPYYPEADRRPAKPSISAGPAGRKARDAVRSWFLAASLAERRDFLVSQRCGPAEVVVGRNRSLPRAP